MDNVRLAVVEPWNRESHRSFSDGLLSRSTLSCVAITDEAHSWQWAMRTGAIALADRIESLTVTPNVFLLSDYVNLPALAALSPSVAKHPSILYLHEDQLTYPLRNRQSRSPEFGAVNLLSCLAATRCVFCSHRQMERFLDALLVFVEKDRSLNSVSVLTAIEDKSQVIHAGVDFSLLDATWKPDNDALVRPLEILWPHRFAHDKNPEEFFVMLLDFARKGLDFRVSAIGREYPDSPPVMTYARRQLGKRVLDWGMKTGEEYANILARADVVVSTALQETLGIAVIESIRAGCYPLLPQRLSYPEVLLPEFHDDHLYTGPSDLHRRLRALIGDPTKARRATRLPKTMDRFSWDTVIPQFDSLAMELHRASDYR